MSESKLNVWILFPDGGTPEQGYGDRHYSMALNYPTYVKTTIFACASSHLFKSPKKTSFPFKKEIHSGTTHSVWVKWFKYKSSHSVKRVLFWFYYCLFILLFGLFTRNKPDVILVSSMPMFPIFSAVILRSLFGTKIIFEIRDIWPLTLYSLSSIKPSHPFSRLLEFTVKYAYKKADFITSNLKKADLHIAETTNSEVGNFEWISNGFALNLGKVNQTDVKKFNETYSFKDGKFNIGYTGSLGEANAMEYFFEATKSFDDQDNIRFVVVGNGTLKAKYVEKYGKDSRIIFIDRIEKTKIQSLLSQMDIVYMGTHNRKLYEYGISANKLFDYMYSRKPILFGTNEKESLVASAGCGLIVKPESPSDIVQGIRKFMGMNSSQLEFFGENGYNYLISNFTYDKLSAKYLKIFKQLLGVSNMEA